MMNFLRFAVTFAMSILCVQPNANATSETDFFRLDFNIASNGVTLANPTLITKAGSPATLSVSSPNGDGYELSVLVESMEDDQVKLTIGFSSEKFGNTAPVLLTRLGQSATLRSGKGTDNPIEIKIVASANKR